MVETEVCIGINCRHFELSDGVPHGRGPAGRQDIVPEMIPAGKSLARKQVDLPGEQQDEKNDEHIEGTIIAQPVFAT